MSRAPLHAFFTSLAMLSLCACSQQLHVTGSDEVANAAGDAAASLDEMLGVVGAVSFAGGPHIFHGDGEEETELTGPERLSCLVTTPLAGLACSSGAKTWALGGDCSSGLRTALTGSVTFAFSDSSCLLGSAGQTITRSFSYEMSGKKLGVMASSSSAQGQVLTRTASGFEFVVHDLYRRLGWIDSESTSTQRLSTPQKWVVTGFNRSGRTISSGTLRVTQEEYGWTAELSITSPLVQTASCNCPSSGVLSGSISGDEEDEAFSVEFVSCGVARITSHGTNVLPVKLDRCAPI